MERSKYIFLKFQNLAIKITLTIFVAMFVLIISGINTTAQITNNQTDNFEDGTVQGWSEGILSSNQPVNITNGGPGGTGDNYLENVSSGGGGAGGKLVMFNTTQWTGDFAGAGVTQISMHLNNLGATNLTIRLAMDGSGGRFSTTNAVALTSGSGWQTVVFSVGPSDLTAIGGSDVNATLGNVTQLRILHNSSPGWKGLPVAATLGVDNITASNVPLSVELTTFTAAVVNDNVELSWKTKTETNNYGFEIERSVASQWKTIGFVVGKGTTAQSQSYQFVDVLSGVSLGVSIIGYRLKQIDTDGSFEYSQMVSIVLNVPQKFQLEQNYPNPFNPTTTIKFVLPGSGLVKIEIFNFLGQKIETLLEKQMDAGFHEIEYTVRNGASGIFFYRIETGEFHEVKKMIVLK